MNNFYYKIYGNLDGPRLVFLHGLMGYSSNWRSIIAHFEKTHACLVYDQRGHGRSFKPETGYAPNDYAEDLYLIVKELGWERFSLVGHSMGGRNALAFAGLYPEHLKHLVIEDIAPGGTAGALVFFNKLFELTPSPFVTREAARDFLLGPFLEEGSSFAGRVELAQFLLSNLESKGAGLDWRFSKTAVFETLEALADPVIDRRQWKTLGALQVPSLLIRGGDSQDLTPLTFQEMLSKGRMMKGVVIPEAGHWVHFDQPAAFVKVLREFLT